MFTEPDATDLCGFAVRRKNLLAEVRKLWIESASMRGHEAEVVRLTDEVGVLVGEVLG